MEGHSGKPGIVSSEHGTDSKKPGTGSIKPGTVGIQPGTVSIRPDIVIVEPGTDSMKPSTVSINMVLDFNHQENCSGQTGFWAVHCQLPLSCGKVAANFAITSEVSTLKCK